MGWNRGRMGWKRGRVGKDVSDERDGTRGIVTYLFPRGVPGAKAYAGGHQRGRGIRFSTVDKSYVLKKNTKKNVLPC